MFFTELGDGKSQEAIPHSVKFIQVPWFLKPGSRVEPRVNLAPTIRVMLFEL